MSQLDSKEQIQPEVLDEINIIEKSSGYSIDDDKFNPLSIKNLLNRHTTFDSFIAEPKMQNEQKIQEEEPHKITKSYSLYNDNSSQGKQIVNSQNLTFEQFIEYLNIKINGDKNQKITKDTLKLFYKEIQVLLNLGSLTRSEKRSKIKIFMKMYNVSNEIIYLLEYKPHTFLDPLLLHIKYKIINRKKKLSSKPCE